MTINVWIALGLTGFSVILFLYFKLALSKAEKATKEADKLAEEAKMKAETAVEALELTTSVLEKQNENQKAKEEHTTTLPGDEQELTDEQKQDLQEQATRLNNRTRPSS